MLSTMQGAQNVLQNAAEGGADRSHPASELKDACCWIEEPCLPSLLCCHAEGATSAARRCCKAGTDPKFINKGHDLMMFRGICGGVEIASET